VVVQYSQSWFVVAVEVAVEVAVVIVVAAAVGDM
jgi:hypothetical protein